MRSLLVTVSIAVLALACSKSERDRPEKVEANEPGPAKAEAPPPKPAAAPPAEMPTSIVVALHEGDGPLADRLAEHAAKAKAAGLVAYVEFTADWCKPCAAFKQYLDDPMMKDALAGTYLVMADYDAFPKDADAMHIIGVPTWLELDEHGAPTGRRISSDVWGEDIPANMAPPLKEFFGAAK